MSCIHPSEVSLQTLICCRYLYTLEICNPIHECHIAKLEIDVSIAKHQRTCSFLLRRQTRANSGRRIMAPPCQAVSLFSRRRPKRASLEQKPGRLQEQPEMASHMPHCPYSFCNCLFAFVLMLLLRLLWWVYQHP